jgi:hypothetical protein
MDIAWQTVLGFVLGIASSFIAWLLTLRFLTPEIRISRHISAVRREGVEDADSVVAYRVKIKNPSRHRRMVDIRVHARLAVRISSGNWSNFHVPLSSDYIPLLGRRGERVLTLRTNEIERRFLSLPPKEREKLRASGVSLERLLAGPTKKTLRVEVTCIDLFSKSIGVSVQRYKIEDIHYAYFKKASTEINLARQWHTPPGSWSPTG